MQIFLLNSDQSGGLVRMLKKTAEISTSVRVLDTGPLLCQLGQFDLAVPLTIYCFTDSEQKELLRDDFRRVRKEFNRPEGLSMYEQVGEELEPVE